MSLIPRPDPIARERRIAGLLFFLTCCSVFAVNLLSWQGGLTADAATRALIFTVTLMAILLAHEMGHVVVARAHGLHLSLPWFLPAPILVGTFGAVIRLRDHPRTRSGLLEMGAAGPLAGLAVVVPVLAFRLLAGPAAGAVPGDGVLGRPLIFWLLSGLLTGEAPPVVSTQDPLAFAAWLGCLLTAMNLLPFGQLDGGHVAGALAPDHARRIGWGVTLLLLAGGLLWPGWAVWAAVLHLMGARHPVEVRRDRSPPSPRARGVAIAAAGALILTLVPVPFRL